MFRLSRLVVVAGAAAILASASAQAADMPGYRTTDPLPLPPREKPYIVEEYVSGWYLRGDLGYRLQHVGSATYNAAPLDDNKLDNVALGGVGAGYKWKWVRMDLTADYSWRGKYSGTLGAADVTAKVDAFTTMLNAYADLGTWGGFTPYIGAGAGGAYMSVSNVTPSAVTSEPAMAKWNFAWAAMAGVSYRLSYNWMLDVGYRHVFLGDATGSSAPTQLNIKKVSGDEIRVGLRFILD